MFLIGEWRCLANVNERALCNAPGGENVKQKGCDNGKDKEFKGGGSVGGD